MTYNEPKKISFFFYYFTSVSKSIMILDVMNIFDVWEINIPVRRGYFTAVFNEVYSSQVSSQSPKTRMRSYVFNIMKKKYAYFSSAT